MVQNAIIAKQKIELALKEYGANVSVYIHDTDVYYGIIYIQFFPPDIDEFISKGYMPLSYLLKKLDFIQYANGFQITCIPKINISLDLFIYVDNKVYKVITPIEHYGFNVLIKNDNPKVAFRLVYSGIVISSGKLENI